MDRRAFAICAGVLLSFSALSVGCGSPSDRTNRPLAETAAPATLVALEPTTAGGRLLRVPAMPSVALVDVEEALPEVPADMPDLEALNVFENVPPAVGSDVLNPLSGETAQSSEDNHAVGVSPADTAVALPEVTTCEIKPLVSPANEPKPEDPAAVASQHTELPWAHVAPRSPEMLAVLDRADQRVRRGFQLAERGATYSARAEFIAALQLITQANDAQQNTRLYSRALSAGLTALEESSDFTRPRGAREEVDVAAIVARHKTTCLLYTSPSPRD